MTAPTPKRDQPPAPGAEEPGEGPGPGFDRTREEGGRGYDREQRDRELTEQGANKGGNGDDRDRRTNSPTPAPKDGALTQLRGLEDDVLDADGDGAARCRLLAHRRLALRYTLARGRRRRWRGGTATLRGGIQRHAGMTITKRAAF